MSFIAPLITLIVFAGLVQLVRVTARENSTWRSVLVGLLWPWLFAAPAVLVQAVRMGEDGFKSLVFLAVGWLIGVGGHSVTLVFEATVGDRQSTLADNFDHYLLLWVAQLLLLFLCGMLRFRANGRLRDKWMVLLGLAVAINAVLNVAWPWWGT